MSEKMKIEFNYFTIEEMCLIHRKARERGILGDVVAIYDMLEEMDFDLITQWCVNGEEYHRIINVTGLPDYEEEYLQMLEEDRRPNHETASNA